MLHLYKARKVFCKKVQELKNEGKGDRKALVALAENYFGDEVGILEVIDVFANHEVDLALKPMNDKDE
jgi:hypothetical protein